MPVIFVFVIDADKKSTEEFQRNQDASFMPVNFVFVIDADKKSTEKFRDFS